MAFLVTGLYGLALFVVGLYFVRQGRKEAESRDKEEHSAAPTWNGVERRKRERRNGERRAQDCLVSR